VASSEPISERVVNLKYVSKENTYQVGPPGRKGSFIFYFALIKNQILIKSKAKWARLEREAISGRKVSQVSPVQTACKAMTA